MKKIKTKLYIPKIKWGKKYLNPNCYYGSSLYTKKNLSKLRYELETEFPKFVGKVVFFESVLEETKY